VRPTGWTVPAHQGRVKVSSGVGGGGHPTGVIGRLDHRGDGFDDAATDGHSSGSRYSAWSAAAALLGSGDVDHPRDNDQRKLRGAAGRDLGDFMVFTLRPDERHPDIQNDAMQYEGLRFRAECTVAGKVYGRPFGVDVAFGDPILGEPEVMVAEDALAVHDLGSSTRLSESLP